MKFFDKPFDLNHDGKLDRRERAMKIHYVTSKGDDNKIKKYSDDKDCEYYDYDE